MRAQRDQRQRQTQGIKCKQDNEREGNRLKHSYTIKIKQKAHDRHSSKDYTVNRGNTEHRDKSKKLLTYTKHDGHRNQNLRTSNHKTKRN